MERLTFDDPDNMSCIGYIEADALAIELSSCDSATETARLILPDDESAGCPVETAVWRHMHRRGALDFEAADPFLASLGSRVVPVRKRMFEPDTLRHSPTLRAALRLSCCAGATLWEQVAELGGPVTESSGVLLAKAEWDDPEIQLRVPLFRHFELVEECYETFERQGSDLLDAQLEFLGRAVREARRDAGIQLSISEAMERAEINTDDAYGKAARALINECRSVPRTDFGDRATAILDRLDRILTRVDIHPHTLRDAAPDRFAELVARNVDPDAATDLFVDVVEYYRSSLDDDAIREAVAILDHDPTAFDYDNPAHAVAVIEGALSQLDPLMYFEALYLIVSSHGDLVASLQLISLDARNRQLAFLDAINRQLYRKVRKGLSPAERRLFQLVHFRQPSIGNMIPGLDPVVRSFVASTDAETLALWLAVVVFKHPNAELAAELRRRYHLFLNFYPVWLLLVASDDLELSDRGEFELRATDHPMQPELAESLNDLATRFCTETERDILVAHICDGQSQTTIAEGLGVSQQAVGQRIKRARTKLRKALVSEPGYEWMFRGRQP